ncbi:protein serine/threonine phosphatase 2C [Trametes cingulata]|nr:protein serine/threonine phosphatase 2C [Trametes cingulata]
MFLEPREYEARRRIGLGGIGGKSATHEVHSVTFQPRGVAANNDRVVTEKWDISGQEWLFLAVFDGHLGSTTAEYTAKNLPTIIRRRLRTLVHKLDGRRLDRSNIASNEPRVTALLSQEITRFDNAIGEALVKICPQPSELTEEQAKHFIERHKDIVERAFSGTTLAFALVNVPGRFMWAAGVGDSSIGLSTIGDDGKVHAQRLCELHSFKNPKEYFRAVMSHSSAENPLIDWEHRILGWMNVARSIGGFALKLPAPYLAHIFRYLPFQGDPPISTYIPKILTPPYIISDPSMRFMDLQPHWGPNSKLFLFTDGVDNLVDGWLVFKPEQHSGADPIDVVAALLADEIDPRIEHILGHQVERRWSGPENNNATDVLGNLLGGKNVARLEMVTDMDRLNDQEGWPFHIDDTSIIVWGLTDM